MLLSVAATPTTKLLLKRRRLCSGTDCYLLWKNCFITTVQWLIRVFTIHNARRLRTPCLYIFIYCNECLWHNSHCITVLFAKTMRCLLEGELQWCFLCCNKLGYCCSRVVTIPRLKLFWQWIRYLEYSWDYKFCVLVVKLPHRRT